MNLECIPMTLYHSSKDNDNEQYVELDEAVVLYYLKNGLMKMILYSRRFINRDLFKYIPFDGSIITISELQELFEAGGQS